MTGDPVLPSGQGDFEEMYRVEGGAIYGFFLRFLPGGEGAEDCLQETFIRVWRDRGRYEERNKRRSYLLAIARNVAYDYLDREKREGLKARNLAWQGTGAVSRDVRAGPAGAEEAREAVRLLRGKIAELPALQRESILMYRYHDLSTDEIARIQGTTRRAVETHIYRGMKALRQSLERHREIFDVR